MQFVVLMNQWDYAESQTTNWQNLISYFRSIASTTSFGVSRSFNTTNLAWESSLNFVMLPFNFASLTTESNESLSYQQISQSFESIFKAYAAMQCNSNISYAITVYWSNSNYDLFEWYVYNGGSFNNSVQALLYDLTFQSVYDSGNWLSGVMLFSLASQGSDPFPQTSWDWQGRAANNVIKTWLPILSNQSQAPACISSTVPNEAAKQIIFDESLHSPFSISSTCASIDNTTGFQSNSSIKVSSGICNIYISWPSILNLINYAYLEFYTTSGGTSTLVYFANNDFSLESRSMSLSNSGMLTPVGNTSWNRVVVPFDLIAFPNPSNFTQIALERYGGVNSVWFDNISLIPGNKVCNSSWVDSNSDCSQYISCSTCTLNTNCKWCLGGIGLGGSCISSSNTENYCQYSFTTNCSIIKTNCNFKTK